MSRCDGDESFSGSTKNSSERHSMRRKLCRPAQANTSSACVTYGNGGGVLKIVNLDLKIPNILSITFLSDAWRRLNNSLAFRG
ncbi:hypothetical protein LguiA_015004 [Lonicera macranthoides]